MQITSIDQIPSSPGTSESWNDREAITVTCTNAYRDDISWIVTVTKHLDESSYNSKISKHLFTKEEVMECLQSLDDEKWEWNYGAGGSF